MLAKTFTTLCIIYLSSVCVEAQNEHHGHHKKDSSSSFHSIFPSQVEKGPKGGKMYLKNGIKLEMVEPSGKKIDVSYYLYDSLSKPLNAQLYKGSARFVFGGSNDFLEASLKQSSKENQYIATMEGWEEYKRVIVSLKSTDGQVVTFVFPNTPSDSHVTKQRYGHHQGGRR